MLRLVLLVARTTDEQGLPRTGSRTNVLSRNIPILPGVLKETKSRKITSKDDLFTPYFVEVVLGMVPIEVGGLLETENLDPHTRAAAAEYTELGFVRIPWREGNSVEDEGRSFPEAVELARKEELEVGRGARSLVLGNRPGQDSENTASPSPPLTHVGHAQTLTFARYSK